MRRRSLAEREWLDARISDTLADADRAVDPDAFCGAVDAAVDELVSRRAVDERDRRAAEANRLWAQPAFDGRVVGGFDYDPLSAATLLNALAAAQGSPAADDPERAPEIPTPQQQSAAGALVEVCSAFLAGDSGGRARPSYAVSIKDDWLDASQPGRLRLRLPGSAPRVSGRRVAEDAAAGADVRVVVVDRAGNPQVVSGPARTDTTNVDAGMAEEAAVLARSLGVPRRQEPGMAALLQAVLAAVGSAASQVERVIAGERPLCDPRVLAAADITTATRIAIAERDQGCRFFGCTAPVDWCDVHHLVHREDGGDHHPDRLALLCRRHHRLVHDHGWTLTLDPASGILTGRRGGVSWRTEPRGSPLAPGPPLRPPVPPERDEHPDPDLPF